ncbi:MAG: TRAP transporter small permease [Pseudomonadota bacterium]
MSKPAAPGAIVALERVGRWAENALLLVMLVLMLTVAMSQIVSRNVFNSGFVWADEFLRLTVLWVALIGSIAASRDHRHLRIDVLSRFLSPRVLRWTNFLVDLFTAVLCAVLAYYSFMFVAETREYEDMAFGGSSPLWWFQSILPIGFGLMAYRYVLWSFRRLLGIDDPQGPSSATADRSDAAS